jgi:hypothetical protein
MSQPAARQPAARETADRASAAQVRALHAQSRALGLDEATYRRALAGYPCRTAAPDGWDATHPDQPWPPEGAGCTHSVQLTRAQARKLITRWSIAGAPVGRPYSGARPAPEKAVATLPTPGQRALIERLRAEVAWRTEDGYAAWLAGRSSPVRAGQIRSYRDAEAVIEALRKMRDRQEASHAG